MVRFPLATALQMAAQGMILAAVSAGATPPFEAASATAVTPLVRADTVTRNHAANPSSASTGRWKVTKTRSPIDDGEVVVASLPADGPIRGPFGRMSRPQLVVRCQERSLQAYIDLGVVPMSDDDDEVAATLRFDKEEAEEQLFSISSDRRAIFAQDGPFVSDLLRRDRLLIRVTPFLGNPVLIAWRLTGSRKALASPLLACAAIPRVTSVVVKMQSVRTGDLDAAVLADALANSAVSIGPCFDELVLREAAFFGGDVALRIAFSTSQPRDEGAGLAGDAGTRLDATGSAHTPERTPLSWYDDVGAAPASNEHARQSLRVSNVEVVQATGGLGRVEACMRDALTKNVTIEIGANDKQLTTLAVDVLYGVGISR